MDGLKPITEETGQRILSAVSGVDAQGQTSGWNNLKPMTEETGRKIVDAVAQNRLSNQEALGNRIKKFYTNSLGETTLADSDDGPIRDLILFGRSRQDGTPAPDAPVEIQSVVNPTVTIRGKNLFDKNAGFIAGVAINNEGVTYPAAGIDTYGFVNLGPFRELSFTNVTILCVFESDKSTVTRRIYLNDAKTKILFTDAEKYYRVSVAQTNKDTAQIEVGDATQYAPYQVQTATLPYTLNAIPVSDGGNVTIDGQQYVADYVDVERGVLVRMVDSSKLDDTVSIADNLDLLLDEQETVPLTADEVLALRTLATYYPTTNVSISSDQLDGYNTFNYPVSLADGWNYVKQQLGDTRDYIYDMDERMTDAEYVAALAYVNSEYAAALTELEV